MVFVSNPANFVTVFLWFWFFTLQIYGLHFQSSLYLCMSFVIHFQMLSCTYHTHRAIETSSQYSFLLCLDLFVKSSQQSAAKLAAFILTFKNFSFAVMDWKNRKALVRSLTATAVPVSVTGCCVSLWFHTCLQWSSLLLNWSFGLGNNFFVQKA